MQFDPRAPEFRANPYPVYDMLRAQAPIFFWEAWGLWFLTTYADCYALLRDNRLGHPKGGGEPPANQRPLFEMMAHWMLLLDPPDHTRLRSLVHKAFTPRMVAQLRGQIEQLTNELLDTVQDQGHMDIIANLAYPLPVNVICALLGVPAADHVRFHHWSSAIAHSLDLTEDTVIYDRAAAAAVALTGYLSD